VREEWSHQPFKVKAQPPHPQTESDSRRKGIWEEGGGGDFAGFYCLILREGEEKERQLRNERLGLGEGKAALIGDALEVTINCLVKEPEAEMTKR